LLKRSKTDDAIDLESGAGAGGTVLVLNEDRDACELIARLVESVGLTSERSYDLTGVGALLDHEGGYSAVVVDSLGAGIAAAFKVLDDVRNASASVRNTPVIILAATDTNRLFAFQSGVDGYVVRPVHAEEFLDTLRLVLARSLEERIEYRRAQLMGGATTN
jgi:DNA-binding response OmpR family regulator